MINRYCKECGNKLSFLFLNNYKDIKEYQCKHIFIVSKENIITKDMKDLHIKIKPNDFDTLLDIAKVSNKSISNTISDLINNDK